MRVRNFQKLPHNWQLTFRVKHRFPSEVLPAIIYLFLDFPDDVLAALDSNQINLFEAHQLARLSAARMKCSAHEAIALRKSVLQSHLMAQGAGSSLRIRVKEILGESDVHPH